MIDLHPQKKWPHVLSSPPPPLGHSFFNQAVFCSVLALSTSAHFIAAIRSRKQPIKVKLSRLSAPGGSLRALTISWLSISSSSSSSVHRARTSGLLMAALVRRSHTGQEIPAGSRL